MRIIALIAGLIGLSVCLLALVKSNTESAIMGAAMVVSGGVNVFRD